MPTYAVQSPTNPMRGLLRGDTGYSFGALTAATIAASPTGLSRAASGIVTLTTSAPHNFVPGEILTIADALAKVTSVGGTRFQGNYMIQTVPSTTTALLLPLDEVILHQPADTGGSGAATSIAAEAPAILTAGKAFGLQTGDQSRPRASISVDGVFLAAPGVFEVDIQGAAVDADSQYATVTNGVISAVDATNFNFHFDGGLVEAVFIRLFIRARANAVGFVGRIRG